jgi:sec-independent protein translocase protein TatA
MGIDNPIHLIFIAAVALLVLGPRRLPEVARSLGRGIREFREAMSDGSVGGFLHDHHDGVAGGPAAAAPAPSPPPEAEVVADGGSARDAGSGGMGWGSVHADTEGVPDAGSGARATVQRPGVETVGADDPLQPVDPAEPVRSGDHAPDRRPL